MDICKGLRDITDRNFGGKVRGEYHLAGNGWRSVFFVRENCRTQGFSSGAIVGDRSWRQMKKKGERGINWFREMVYVGEQETLCFLRNWVVKKSFGVILAILRRELLCWNWVFQEIIRKKNTANKKLNDAIRKDFI